jgi:3-hydroxyisobutyrate dehydrogenase
MTRTAVLGTGLMGAGMARSLARSGHAVTAWNRTRANAEPLTRDEVTVTGSAAEAVDGADVVVTMLFDTDATAAVAREILPTMGEHTVWLQCGTVGVDGIRALSGLAGGRLLDAPVLGTRRPAEEGNLVVLLSGPATLRERVSEVCAAIGSRTIVAGDEVGAASALKLACNAWVALLTAGTAQSLALAESLGVDPRLFLEAIDGGPVSSPYAALKGGAMLAGDWATSFAVDGVVKDVGLMVEAGRAVGFPTGLLDAVRSAFVTASEQGHGGDDMAAVRTAFPPPPAG